MPKMLDPEKVAFIFKNKDKMRQADIARHLKVYPSTVNQILKGKRIYHEANDEYFNIDAFKKYYQY